MSAASLRRTASWVAGAGVLGGAATLAYAAGWEVRNFVIRRAQIAALPPGSDPLKALHISDVHLVPRQGRKRAWLASLAELEPDLVINTGDNLAHQGSVEPLLEGFGPLLDLPGVFVFGSNDYFSPKLRNPARYLLPDDGTRNIDSPQLPFEDLRSEFLRHGWLDLNNAFGSLVVKDTRISFAGVDDPHLDYDDLDLISGPADAAADLRIGVTHAPYLRVLDQFSRDGYDITVAGHTHGGQLCLPIKGALVTNCDLDRARVSGLHRHPADSMAGDAGSSWLQVSAGAGTSPYAPVRFCCRPEAVLITLTAQVSKA